jgi:hypothetical protein
MKLFHISVQGQAGYAWATNESEVLPMLREGLQLPGLNEKSNVTIYEIDTTENGFEMFPS